MNIIGGLGAVAITLLWSLFISAIAVFLYFSIRTLQGRLSTRKRRSPEEMLCDLRSMLVLVPVLWVILSFSDDANSIADTMFNFWLPVVLIFIMVVGLAELILPVWHASRKEGTRLIGGRISRYRKKSEKRRKKRKRRNV